MHRGWLENPAFGGKREPFCRRSAWAWLIENAAYREHDITVAGKPIHIARGQLRTSFRSLGQQWGWPEPKVRRYFRVLNECQMTVCVSDALATLITICNYERYQILESVGDAGSDALVTHSRRTSGAAQFIFLGNEGNEGEEPPPIVPPHANGGANGRRKPRTQFPADWRPSERGIEFALAKGHDHAWIAYEGDHCRDHHRAKGNVFADLDAAWFTWVRNADSFAAPRNGSGGAGSYGRSSPQPGPIAAAMRAVLDRGEMG